jgi:hypothetical protein
MQPLTFQDLAPNQLCTFIRTLDLGLQDVLIGVRTPDDQLHSIYSMNGSPSINTSITGEYLRRSCAFVSAGEILSIDPIDYPEVCL